MPIIENGRLSQYLISLYMSRKMNTAPTRAATTIVEFGNRKGSQQELVGSLSRGLLVTGFNGGNCNGTTGDFSFGIEGFLIEKGIITQPIAGMLMTGNMLSLWNNLTAVADDAPTCVAWHTPSLLFSDVNVR